MSKISNVVKFYPKDAAKSPDTVLEQARGQYNNLLIIGWDKKNIFSAHSDLGLDAGDLILLVEFFKQKLLNGDFNA